MMKTFTPFNINESVRVKLTDYGRRILQTQHEELVSGILARTGVRPSLTYQAPTEDAEGWSRWQLWTLMQTFGEFMSMGCELPFATEIEIELAPLVLPERERNRQLRKIGML